MAHQLTTHVHRGEELAATLQLESSEEDSAFCTASEAIENHNTGVLASPTLEARHCSTSSSSSQFVSAHSVSTLLSSGNSHPDDKLELEIQASEVHWSKLNLEPCSSNSKPRSSELEQEIEASKVHWSELSSSQSWSSESSDGETNRTIFQKMRQDPLYQNLFRIDFVDVLVGQKIAEGGQAEIFELDYCRTRLKNISSGGLEWFDLELPCVLKVFKAGYSLHDLQSQWPENLMRKYYNWRSGKNAYSDFRSSIVVGGVVLEDDRFAFVLQREGVDLRKLIDVFQDEKSLKWEPENRIFEEYLTFHPQRSNRRGTGPVFKRRLAHGIIYQIALGMRELHEFDILHRDLKASNVLINDVQGRPKFPFEGQRASRSIRLRVADYECSVGVVGTGFWRAPEILQQLKDDPKRKHPVQFTRGADVYSFAMTCYEVLTGRLPLEEYATHDFDVVLGGIRPSLPEYIPNWLKNLITSCWQHKPCERPTFEAIVKVIEDFMPFSIGPRSFHLSI